MSTLRSLQKPLRQPQLTVSQNSTVRQSSSKSQGKRWAGTKDDVVAADSLVVVSAGRVMNEVMSVVKSRFCVVSSVVVKSSSVTKDVSTDVSADVSEIVVSRVVVSWAVTEDVSVSMDVWNEVSLVVTVVSVPTAELGLGQRGKKRGQ
jgi:hypothetical protein